jgi:MFS family permease
MGLSGKTNVWWLLVLGRLVAGVSTGLSLTAMPLLVMETAPRHFHGPLGCLQHIFICLGSTVGEDVCLANV